MSSFTGFHDDDHQTEDLTLSSNKVKLSTNRRQKEKLLQAAANQKMKSVIDCSSANFLSPDARLSAPPAPAASVKLKISEDGKCEVMGQDQDPLPDLEHKDVSGKSSNLETAQDNTANTDHVQDVHKIVGIAEDSGVSKIDMVEKQKLIEEQNRKKKEMLLQAILDRKKKTDTEARKLDLVNQELQKIDLMLTSDVKFLRNSIEQASVDYMEAQKRYDKAEKEFVEAKLHLHNCHEKKDLLKDHLSAIIEQNELRKSKKLNSLLDELNIK